MYEVIIKKDGEQIANGGVSADGCVRILVAVMNQKAFEEGDVKYKPAKLAKNEEEEEEPAKKARKCKSCGKPGHRRDNCPTKYKKPEEEEVSEMSAEDKEKLEQAEPDEQSLVWDIRSAFLVQKKAAPVVCNDLDITMERFIDICKKYNIHR